MKTSVSASQSCGKRSATWATGQWCWQSCSPAAEGSTEAAYPSADSALAKASAGVPSELFSSSAAR